MSSNRKQKLIDKINEKVRIRNEIKENQEREIEKRQKEQKEITKELKQYFSDLPPYNYRTGFINDDLGYVTIYVLDDKTVKIYVYYSNNQPSVELDKINVIGFNKLKTLYDNREQILEKILEELK